jgi:hypothetical protein
MERRQERYVSSCLGINLFTPHPALGQGVGGAVQTDVKWLRFGSRISLPNDRYSLA